MWYKNIKKILCFGVITIGVSIATTVAVYADDREHLKDTLNSQEEELTNEMKPINPIDSEFTKNIYDQALSKLDENFKNSTGNIDTQGKIEKIQKGIFSIAVKTRTVSIIMYVAIWILGILYAAVMGSRDVNKRRKVFLIIRNSTVLFLVYVNIPLLIIWLNGNSNIANITLFNVIYEIMMFLQKHSIIISCLFAYAGIVRLIISKNNLPVRRQATYLIKFAVILLIFLNIIPMAMYFLI